MMRLVRPSLRDFGDSESEPGSELPDYSQISLREMENTDQIVKSSRGGGDAAAVSRTGFQPVIPGILPADGYSGWKPKRQA